MPLDLISHDLGRLAKALMLPASTIQKIPDFHLLRDGACHPIDQAHQAWRYGIAIRPNDEQTLREWLNGLHSKMGEEML